MSDVPLKNLFLTHQQSRNTLSTLHSPGHCWWHRRPSNCCTNQLNLKYELHLITSNRTAPK